MPKLRVLRPLLLLLTGCPAPAVVFLTPGEVDRAAGRGDVETVCHGLEQKAEEARERAATVLKTWEGAGAECLCTHLTREGRWDPAVLRGLKGASGDSPAGCAGALLDDAAAPDRAGAATALLDVRVPGVRERLVLAARGDAEVAVRAAAIPILRGTRDPAEQALLVEALRGSDAALAAAAAGALAGVDAGVAPLRSAVETHASAPVRLAALEAYQSLHAADWSEAVCHAALADPAPEVRAAAVRLTRESHQPEVWSCLRERALTLEPDASVRLALLDTLAASSDPAAGDILCEAIPFWVRSYVGEAPVAADSDLDIFGRQNDRDFKRSYACVEAAVAGQGYSQEGRSYLCSRYRELGGARSVPGCPRRGGAREISF